MTDDRVGSAPSDAAVAMKPDEPTSRLTPVITKDNRQKAFKSLFATAGHSVDDKLATVKTAHHVDKDLFQSAFRSLMDK